jgi:hypothetical protein
VGGIMYTSIKKIEKKIKFILKYVFFIGAYIVGVYIGIYLLMYCSVRELVSIIKKGHMDVLIILINLLKIILAIPIGSAAWGIMYMLYNYCRGYDD